MNKGRSKGKRISQRMVIIGIGALAMIGVTVFFLVTSKKPTSSPAPTTIATFQVKKHELRVPGQVQAVRTQKIDIPEGTVQNMTVKNGDSVTLDQQLLTVYKPDVQAKIDEASRALEKQQRSQATLDQQISQIKATLSKTAADDPQKSALQTQLDEAQNNRQDSADAITQSNQDIAKLKQSLNTVVKAPFAGRLYIDYQARPSRKPRLKLKPLVRSPNLIIQVLKSVNLQPYRRWQAKQSKRQTSILLAVIRLNPASRISPSMNSQRNYVTAF